MDNKDAQILPLDETIIKLISELDAQSQMLESLRQGALMLFIRNHDLQGKWQLATNRKEIYLVSEQVSK